MSEQERVCISWMVSVCRNKNEFVSVGWFQCVGTRTSLYQLDGFSVSEQERVCISWMVSVCRNKNEFVSVGWFQCVGTRTSLYQLDGFSVSEQERVCISWMVSVCRNKNIKVVYWAYKGGVHLQNLLNQVGHVLRKTQFLFF